MKRIGILFLAHALFLCPRPLVFSQSMEDKISLSIRVGPNLWLNDMNDRKVGFGVDAVGRYGISKHFSVGASIGYDVLRSHQTPLVQQNVAVDYLRLNAWHGSLGVWLQLSTASKFAPYLYAGIGDMVYTRKDGLNSPYPAGDKPHTSIYVPFGIGFESHVSKNGSLMFDFGYRVLEPGTDLVPSGADSYPSVKLGYSIFFGANDDDDEDEDGLLNGKEADIGTDPHNPDTDGDGLNDGEETKLYRSKPLNPDTDSDGLKDGDEVWRFRTDPTKADSDGDGVTDGDEIFKYNTDPLRVDTDKDGLSDGEEVLKYHTDPLKPDTDGDGLTDSSEIFGYKTDPLKADTDAGTVDDGVEVKRNTNPLFAGDDLPRQKVILSPPFAIGAVITLEGIKFKPWSSELTLKAELALEKVLEMLSLHPQVEGELRCHTDDGGGRDRNVKISKERAETVKRWLEARGIASNRLTAKGHGSADPVASNKTEAGQEKNRRIEFVRTK